MECAAPVERELPQRRGVLPLWLEQDGLHAHPLPIRAHALQDVPGPLAVVGANVDDEARLHGVRRVHEAHELVDGGLALLARGVAGHERRKEQDERTRMHDVPLARVDPSPHPHVKED